MRITAQQTVGDHRIRSMLTADSLGTPQAYNVTVKTGNATELTAALRRHWDAHP